MGDELKGTRSTNAGDSRTSVDSGKYIVWLQSLCPIADEEINASADSPPAREGTHKHLQKLFNLVGQEADLSIEVRWTEDVSAESVKDKEIVIYLVKDYASGLISSYVDGRIADESLSAAEKQPYEDLQTANANTEEAGLTLNEVSWSLCEVYVHDCYEARKGDLKDASNRNQLLEDCFGRMIANLGFHEAMHNKVDPTQADTWDLHKSGGKGLAKAEINDQTAHTDKNIELMASAVKKNQTQYIHGTTQAPPPKEKPKETPKKDDKEKPASTGFEDLSTEIDLGAP